LRLGEKVDLVITDVDMPRMNGIELVKLIRGDSKLRDVPVMILSYKERDEDRLLGLEAGANYYLPKNNFQDEAIVNAIIDLIGPA
jgi:two-component system sensor histidine kinase and response regulator WspE